MHDVVENSLEDALAGKPNRELESHLAECAKCRDEVHRFRAVSSLFTTLRPEAPVAVPLGFDLKVMRNIQSRKRRTVWDLFVIDPAFARKLALASLAGLAAFGSYLATQPADAATQAMHTPEAVMASHDLSVPANNPQHMDGMLVTLATYHP